MSQKQKHATKIETQPNTEKKTANKHNSHSHVNSDLLLCNNALSYLIIDTVYGRYIFTTLSTRAGNKWSLSVAGLLI